MIHKKRFYGMAAAALALTLIFGACDLQGEKEDKPDDSVTYTVTFDSDGGTPATQTRTVSKDASLGSLPANPSKTGYTFGGWYRSRNGGGESFTTTTKVIANITVYAKWTPVSSVRYTVTYSVNGGTGTAPPAQTANSGTEIPLADGTGLTKASYTFSGWNTSASGDGTPYAGGASFLVTSDITLYAMWIGASSAQYTVTYNVNGGTGTTPPAQTVNSGVLIPLADGSGLTQAGYTFSGWNTSASGTGTSYNAGASFPVTSNITLYAAWIVASGVQYTVTYNVNGGSGTTPPAQTENSETEITLADGTGLTKAGYMFSGWNTSASGDGTPYAAGASFPVTSNITLYAAWIVASGVQYTVTYDVNGGSGTAPAAQTENSGTSITPAGGSGLTKEGYTFSGWNTGADGTGTTYAGGASLTGTSDITLYAMWSVPTTVPASTLQEALIWLDSNAESGGVYTITLNADENMGPKTLSYGGKVVSITIDGGTAERTINLSANGSLFTVESGIALTLGNNLTLQGRSNNTASLLTVSDGVTLAMETGSKLTGNTSSGSVGGVSAGDSATITMSGGAISGNSGGGVSMGSSATFTMSDGIISGSVSAGDSATFTISDGEIGGSVSVGDSATFTMSGGEIGGGVSVGSNATFTMNNGAISDGGVSAGSGATFTMNNGAISGGGVSVGSGATFTMNNGAISGGRVYVASSAVFTMSGGTISGNTAAASNSNLSSSSNGGGVYVASSGTFTMSGGTISGNTASASASNSYSYPYSNGGGVYVASSGTFTMSGGTISGNTASASYSSNGGGVYVASSGTFTMSDGAISGNTASASSSSSYSSSNGGGVYVASSGTFTMSGGTISGNTASSYSSYSSYSSNGGGVSVDSSATFIKQSGGIIYGLDADSDLKNTADNGGHAVYVDTSPAKQRNSTAGAGVTLDSGMIGSAGGWVAEYPATLQVTLQPVLNTPPLANATLFVDGSATFNAGDGYDSYVWYWDGEAISSAASSSYTLAAHSKTQGIYELSVFVETSAGNLLSARCQVTINVH
jgi:uncharacterized repeat protein (TIGR02543 family)